MEGEVATEIGMNQRIVSLAVLVCRIDSLHAGIETQEEIVQVQPETKSIGYRYLLPTCIPSELSSRLVLVVTKRPDIAGIYKEGSVKLPEQVYTQLGTHVKFHVAGLVDKVYIAVVADEGAGTKTSYAPATHTVGTTAEDLAYESDRDS